MAAFQVGYTIMQPVGGFIVDLIGLRIGFALFGVLWLLAGVLHAGASGWLSLAGFRALMGLTEAAAIPSGMKAVDEWFPDKEKSVAVGWYLSAGARWVSYWSDEAFDGGQTVALLSPLDQPAMLVREGGVIALNVAEQHFDQRADQRGFLVAPMHGVGEAVGGCIEGDGETEAWRNGEQGRWSVRAVSDAQTIALHVSREDQVPTQAGTVEIHLPAGDARQVQAPQARVLENAVVGGWRRLTLQLLA